MDKVFKRNILVIFFILAYPFFSFSQEQITITTYYPSPFGEYNELGTNRLRIGAGTMPDDNGVVNFAGLAADPAGANSNVAGTIYYNNVGNEFMYHDGAAWRLLGLSCLRRTYDAVSGQRDCPAGYQLAGVAYDPSVALPATGQYLCCIFCNDFDFDDNCD